MRVSLHPIEFSYSDRYSIPTMEIPIGSVNKPLNKGLIHEKFRLFGMNNELNNKLNKRPE